MLAFLIYPLALALGTVLLVGVAGWAVGRRPVIRNLIAFCLACLSSYSVGFLLDMWGQGLSGSIPTANLILPSITWFWIATASLIGSFNAAASPFALGIPFFFNSVAACLAAGINARHLLVGVPLFLLGGAAVLLKRRRGSSEGTPVVGSG